jgi:hypothetical protein
MRGGASENPRAAGCPSPEPAVPRAIFDNQAADRPNRRRAALCAAVAACLLPVALGQGPPAAEPVAEQPAAPADPESILFNPDAADDARAGAAALIVEQQRFDGLATALEASGDPIAARHAIDALLAGADTGDASRRALGAAALLAPDESAERALAGLGESRSRAAVRAALRVYTADRAPSVRAAALRALIRQTGMSQLGDDPARWRAWWTEVEWLSEPEWRARVATAQGDRAHRLEQQRDALAARLVDAHRRLHAALPPEQRSTLVAELIVDERVELRLLGLDLAQRAMLNARPLTDGALAAAIEQMRDPDDRVRTQAAQVVGRASPPNAADAASIALAAETNAQAAGAQLAILTRFPTTGAIDGALRWLGGATVADSAAADALAAMARAGMLDGVSHRASALERAREIPARRWTPAHVRLLDAIGEHDDLRRIADDGLLRDSPEVRLACAGALARRAGWDDALADALRSDPALLGAIAQGIGLRLASLAGLERFRAICAEAGVTENLLEHENALIGLMPAPAALEVIASIEPPERRLALLDGLASRPEPADETLLTLARERIGRGDGAGALAVADRLRDPSSPDARAVLVLALAWTNDLDRAAALDAPASAWIDAYAVVERAGLAHAPAVAARALTLHGDTLDAADRARLQRGSENARQDVSSVDGGSPTKSSGGSDGSAS